MCVGGGALLIPWVFLLCGVCRPSSCFSSANVLCIHFWATFIISFIIMIIAATISGLSVGKLFLAGAIPGTLLGLGLMVVAYVVSVKEKYPKHPRSTFPQLVTGFLDTFWALLMTFIILFGIVGGVFTPTEASIIAILYALIIGFFVYKHPGFTRKEHSPWLLVYSPRVRANEESYCKVR